MNEYKVSILRMSFSHPVTITKDHAAVLAPLKASGIVTHAADLS